MKNIGKFAAQNLQNPLENMQMVKKSLMEMRAPPRRNY